jgi:3-oxoacyl-[acyl-carrier-protein] synthase II
VRDLAITGAGLLTPIGGNVASSWEAFRAGRLGVVRAPASSGWDGWWAEIPGAYLAGRLDPVTAKRTDHFVQYALIAAGEALAGAALTPDPERTAVVLGSTMGGVPSLTDARAELDGGGPTHVSPRLITYVIPNMAAAALAIRWGLHGPQLTISTACASSLDAIGHAARLIERGDADVALAGGTETPLASVVAWSLQHAGALATATEARLASRPFDRARTGFVMGDGCGVIVLERGAAARRRGARILGYLRGYSSLADGFHPSSPDPTGRWESRAMRLALAEAELDADAIDAVFAHGTATRLGDAAEMCALNAVYSERRTPIPVTSLKGHVGHSMAASGVTALVIALRGMAERSLVATLGTTELDPAARFDLVIGEARAMELHAVQVNAFGFGGQNASLVIADQP